MHRRGHVGMALLAYAPVGFLLLQDRQIGLALLGLLGVLTVEPLPDSEFWVPGLRHRRASHSILCALVVGGVIGALGGWPRRRRSQKTQRGIETLSTSTRPAQRAGFRSGNNIEMGYRRAVGQLGAK